MRALYKAEQLPVRVRLYAANKAAEFELPGSSSYLVDGHPVSEPVEDYRENLSRRLSGCATRCLLPRLSENLEDLVVTRCGVINDRPSSGEEVERAAEASGVASERRHRFELARSFVGKFSDAFLNEYSRNAVPYFLLHLPRPTRTIKVKKSPEIGLKLLGIGEVNPKRIRSDFSGLVVGRWQQR